MLAGSRGYGALKRTALGSVAGHLVDSAACPSWCCRAGWGWIRSRSVRKASASRAPIAPRSGERRQQPFGLDSAERASLAPRPVRGHRRVTARAT